MNVLLANEYVPLEIAKGILGLDDDEVEDLAVPAYAFSEITNIKVSKYSKYRNILQQIHLPIEYHHINWFSHSNGRFWINRRLRHKVKSFPVYFRIEGATIIVW